jgi:hypothetical protein
MQARIYWDTENCTPNQKKYRATEVVSKMIDFAACNGIILTAQNILAVGNSVNLGRAFKDELVSSGVTLINTDSTTAVD